MTDVPGTPGAAPGAPDPDAPDLGARQRFTPAQLGAAIGFGVLGLLLSGLFALLLGRLAAEGRLSAAQLGVTATVETLATGLTAAFFGARMPPERLKLTALLATAGLALTYVLSAGLSGWAVVAARLAAGVPEGVLLQIAIGAIARTERPDRWAAVLTAGQMLSQFTVAAALASFVLPRAGSDGGFRTLAVVAIACGPAVVLLASRYTRVVTTAEPPPLPRVGWLALVGTGLFIASLSNTGVYIAPFAKAAGLSSRVVDVAITAALGLQLVGAGLATWLAGRWRPIRVFLATTPAILLLWAVLVTTHAALVFQAACALSGAVAFFAQPSLVALAVDADPSRRTALQSGAAQLLGGALGPLLGAGVAAILPVRAVIGLSVLLLLAALATFAAVDRITRRESGAA